MNTRAGSFALNFWTLTSSKVLSRLVSIGVMVYLARELGADVLGQYVTVMSLITFFLAFADMGVTNLVIKEVSKDHTLSQSYLNNFFALQIVVGILVMALIMGTGRLSGYGAVVLLALAVGSIGPFFSGMSNAYQALLNAHELFYPFAVIEMACVFVYLAGNVAVVVTGEGVVALVAVTSVVMLVKLLLGAGWSYRLGIRVRRRFDAGLMKRLLVSGLPFLLINGGHFAFQRLDVLFLSWTVSNERVGLYAAASRPVFASLFLLASIGALLYPVFSRLLVKDPNAARLRYEKGSGYLFVFATGAALFFYLAAPVLVTLMYGAAFHESAAVLRLLAWFLPLFAAGLFASNVLMVSEHVWKAVHATLIAFVVLIVAELLLIPRLEIQGAAIGVLCAETVATVLYVYWVRAKLSFKLRLRVFAGTVVAALTVVLFESYVADAASSAFTSSILATTVTILAGMTVFLLIVYISKAFTADDMMDIRGLMASKGRQS